MAISDKLEELLVIKQDIKEAIENKGVDLTDVEFRGYPEKINQIETGGETDPLITLYALHSWRSPSETTTGTTTWSIPEDILDYLYCVRISNDQFRFYKLTDCYLVGASVGSTTYTKRLNTATGTLTRNTSTNGNEIGFDILNTPPGNISPGKVGLLPIIPPEKHITFTLNREVASISLKRYHIPKSVLLEYYPDFSNDMIALITLYDRDIRVTTLPWLL